MRKRTFFFLLIGLSVLFSCSKPIAKQSQGPASACFTVVRDTFYVGDTVVFTDCSVNADTLIYNFGDGATSTLRSPGHIYLQRGSYSVSLNASNRTNTSVVNKTIVIKAGIPSNLPWRYFAPGSNTDSMLFLGTGNGSFLVWGYDIVDGGLKIPGNFTNKDSFVFNNDNCCGISISGGGHFSLNDSTVYMTFSNIYQPQYGNPQFWNDTFYGIRR